MILATEWPSVVAAVAGAVGAIAAAAGAAAAWRSAGKSADTARDAQRALAMLTFPALLHHVYQQVADPQDESRPMNRWHMDVWNTSGWDAVDVRAELRLTDGRLLTGRTERLRPSSASPPRPDDDQLVIEIPDMPDDNVAGYALIRETVVRWRDARGLAGWEARKDWARGYNPPAAQVLRQIEGPSISVR